jgi:large subunit ribosomal protein LP0
MPGESAAKKQVYFTKLQSLLEEYSKIFIVTVDNVGSNQMQQIRQSLRKEAVVLMGKNTMMRKAMRGYLSKNTAIEVLLPRIKGNVGLVFTNKDLVEIRKKILENRVGAPAKAGSLAPNDVFIPAGPTGLDPTQTSFLQALNISTKINKGQIEINSDVHLCKKGEKVGNSEAALLQKLNIKPFSYGLMVSHVYDSGFIYEPSVLDLSDDDILAKFKLGVRNVTAVSLAIRFPTALSVPHLVIKGYKNVLAIAVGTNYSFPLADKLKAYLANPGAFAAAAAPAATKAAAPAKETKKEEPKKEEPKEEEEETDMGFGLFD